MKNPWAKLTAPWRSHLSYQSAGEEQFCTDFMQNNSKISMHIALQFACPMNGMCVIALMYHAPPSIMGYVLALHCYNFFSQLIYLLGGKKWINPVHLANTNWGIPALGYATLVLFHSELQVEAEYMSLLLTITCMCLFFLVSFVSYKTRPTLVINFISLAFSVGCFLSLPNGYLWAVLILTIGAWCMFVNRVYYLKDQALAIKEYRARKGFLPADIVKRSADVIDIEAVFEPDERSCVCISSDWRDFQNLAQHVTSAQLAEMIEVYYDKAASLLAENIPKENYFMDWIADELFVVLYADSDEQSLIMVNQALDFSLALCAAKPEIARRFGIDLNIDIGLSSGIAHLGLFGSSGHMKATALGEVPGRSRRLQSFGKHLRAQNGSRDRILFDKDTLMLISKPYDVSEHAVPEEKKIRNLTDQKVFVIEPKAAQEAA